MGEIQPATAGEKVLHVLSAFEEKPEWILHELAVHLQIPKSSLHRHLAALRAFGYVQQDPRTGRYLLGSRIAALASAARRPEALVAAAYPFLTRLVDETGETAFITVREGLHAVCASRVNTPHGVRLLIEVGTASPLHLGASNTALLAFLPEVERSMILSQTVIQPEALTAAEAAMDRIAKAGYAYSCEDLTPGAAALGVPVFGADGVMACLSIGAPSYRFRWSEAERHLPALLRAAAELSRKLAA
jgi:DNA-binding IclR family transcriptional regulator